MRRDEFPRSDILGNSASGDADSRKPTQPRSYSTMTSQSSNPLPDGQVPARLGKKRDHIDNTRTRL
jgi:hypothetical protein